MPIAKTCENCGQPFSVKPSHAAQRFCELSCKTAHEYVHGRPAAQAVPIAFTCEQCGGQFSMKPAYLAQYRKMYGKDPKYCSTKCSGLAKRLTDEQWQVTCIQCGNPMPIQRRPGGTVNRQKRLCSTECRSAFRRERWQAAHANAQPTRRIVRHGYIRLIVPGTNGNPSRDVLEHRYVMEQHIGRPLLPEETVHHKRQWDKTNNSLDNLELWSSNHGPGGRVTDIVAWCIDMLRLYPEFAARTGVKLVNVENG